MKKIFRLGFILLIALVLYGGYLVFGAKIKQAYYNGSAAQARESGDIERAADLYYKALSFSPRDEELRLLVCGLYTEAGNFTRAENTMITGLRDVGPYTSFYRRLCALYVAQDKLEDAVLLLDGVKSPAAKSEIDAERPQPPVFSVQGGVYNERIAVELSAQDDCVIYAAWDGSVPSVTGSLYTEAEKLPPGVSKGKAVAVNNAGLVSVWAECEYSLENIIDPVVFEDPAVERAVRLALEKPDGMLYSNDLWLLEELIAPEPADYVTLSDLYLCVNLKTVSLTGVRGRCDISALTALPELKELSLTAFGIDAMDLEWVGQITGLEKLSLRENSIGSVLALQPLKQLVALDLSTNSILNTEPLASLSSLQALNLSQNAVQELAQLSPLTGLLELVAAENRITSVTGVNALKSLKRLDVSNNASLAYLDGVSELANLEALLASHCRLQALPDMSKLTVLAEIDVSSNELSSLEGVSESVKTLLCEENSIGSLEPLKGCNKLTELSASKNGITSVEPLRALPELKTLRVENNGITTLLSLKECPALKEIYAFGNTLADPINAFDGTGISVFRQ